VIEKSKKMKEELIQTPLTLKSSINMTQDQTPLRGNNWALALMTIQTIVMPFVQRLSLLQKIPHSPMRKSFNLVKML
jgi:hypothetical protein